VGAVRNLMCGACGAGVSSPVFTWRPCYDAVKHIFDIGLPDKDALNVIMPKHSPYASAHIGKMERSHHTILSCAGARYLAKKK
jgi:hypothetical protein